jgi:hypothetical protein
MQEPKGGDAVAFLDRLLEFFEDGRRWIKGLEYDSAGNRCLRGAITYVTYTHGIRPLEAEAVLREAMRELLPPGSHPPDLILFNDTRRSFDDIRQLILDARALAIKKRQSSIPSRINYELQDWAERRFVIIKEQSAKLHANWVLAELKHKQAIWAARAATRAAKVEAAAQLSQAGEQARQMLLAEIERERAERIAAGDTSPTWISCPRVPEPERIAA